VRKETGVAVSAAKLVCKFPQPKVTPPISTHHFSHSLKFPNPTSSSTPLLANAETRYLAHHQLYDKRPLALAGKVLPERLPSSVKDGHMTQKM
jgi:hypothetical protein